MNNPQIIIDKVAAEFNITPHQLINGKFRHCLNARIEAAKQLYLDKFAISDIRRFLKMGQWSLVQYYLKKNGLYQPTTKKPDSRRKKKN